MTLLFAGGEDVDFTSTGGSATVATSAGTFRSGYGRCTVGWAGNTSDPPVPYGLTPLWPSGQSAFWFHAQFYAPTITFNASCIFLTFCDSSNVQRLAIRPTGTTGQLKFSKRNAAGTWTDLVTFSTLVSATTLTQLDIQINYAVAGSINVYFANVLVATYSGDITTDGVTALQYARLGNVISSVAMPWSEVIINTNDTRAMSLVTLTSSTAGTTQSWSGTASNVNQTTINDANFIYSASANQIQEYKPGSLPTGSFNVIGVVMSARALKGASGPANMQFVTRISTTEYTSSSQALTASFANYANYIQETNPSNSSAWVTTDLASSNFQYGLKSIT